MGTNIKFVVFLLIAIVISVVWAFLNPTIRAAHLEIPLITALAATLTQLAAVWYFFTAARTFKRTLKIAYSLVALGILFFSVVLLIPVMSVTPGLSTVAGLLSPTAYNVLIIISYMFSALCIYIGMRMFAKVLSVRHIFTSWPLVLGVVIVVGAAVLGGQYKGILGAYAGLFVSVVMAFVAWCAVFSLIATVLTLKIRGAIGNIYKRSVILLTIALASLAFATLHELIVKTIFIDSSYVVSQLTLWPFLLVGICFLRAGMAFKDTGRAGYIRLGSNPSYVDIVTSAAQMVSQPTAVDAALDKVRTITASQNGQQELSASDKTALLDTYLYLEGYLITTEPLHKVTKEGLRNNLPDVFVKDLAKREANAAATAAA